MTTFRLRSYAAFAALPLFCLALASRAGAVPLSVVTPGEQNTQSGENGCAATPCAAGHWLHYPELLQVALGATAYTVHNNGDGGAVLGCDATTATVAGNNSFCKSSQYTSSITPPPDVVIIGPFGEHDQRIVTASAGNETSLYMESVFQNAYEGLVQDYLKYTQKIYMMTPIDVPWGGTTALPNGEDLVKDIMLPAATKVAQNHQLTIIDTYTAISGTPALVTQYYGTDGQVNAAGQQKMADMILAALSSSGTGGAGGASGAGGGGGSGGASGAVGVGGTGGGSTASGGTSTAAAGTTNSGAAGSSVITTGSSGASSVGGAPNEPLAPASSSDSGGCSVALLGQHGSKSSLLLALMAFFGLTRRRRRSAA